MRKLADGGREMDYIGQWWPFSRLSERDMGYRRQRGHLMMTVRPQFSDSLLVESSSHSPFKRLGFFISFNTSCHFQHFLLHCVTFPVDRGSWSVSRVFTPRPLNPSESAYYPMQALTTREVHICRSRYSRCSSCQSSLVL